MAGALLEAAGAESALRPGIQSKLRGDFILRGKMRDGTRLQRGVRCKDPL